MPVKKTVVEDVIDDVVGVVVDDEATVGVDVAPAEVAESVQGKKNASAPAGTVVLGELPSFNGKYREVIFPGCLGHDPYYVWAKMSWIIESGGVVYIADDVDDAECYYAKKRFDRVPGERAYRRR